MHPCNLDEITKSNEHINFIYSSSLLNLFLYSILILWELIKKQIPTFDLVYFEKQPEFIVKLVE